jgi:hypothetical protein
MSTSVREGSSGFHATGQEEREKSMRRSYWAVLAAALACASAAHAENTFTIPYQQYASKLCQNDNSCTIAFPPVKAQTLILNATCYLFLESGGPVHNSFLSLGKSNTLVALPVFAWAANGIVTDYGINASTYLFVSQGVAPEIEVNSIIAQSTFAIECIVSGNQQ